MSITYAHRPIAVNEYLALEASLPDFDTTTADQAAMALAHQITSIVAESNGEVVGFGRIIGDAAIYWCFVDIWVRPEFQGRGIGSELVKQLVAFVRENAIVGTSVSVFLLAAKSKEAFYERFGFVSRPNNHEGAAMELELVL